MIARVQCICEIQCDVGESAFIWKLAKKCGSNHAQRLNEYEHVECFVLLLLVRNVYWTDIGKQNCNYVFYERFQLFFLDFGVAGFWRVLGTDLICSKISCFSLISFATKSGVRNIVRSSVVFRWRHVFRYGQFIDILGWFCVIAQLLFYVSLHHLQLFAEMKT